ncbi:MAG TPA: NAD(P)H-hydrate dehydratase [Gemmatimonadales bacterium]|nr:NAD(P)H-hydrate dehydratase [Gemmatimonadales bacterium]
MIPVLSPEQSSAWDRLAESAGIELATLMEAAGRAVATVIADRYPAALRLGVLVAAGPGNNGGDGWVTARALHAAGVPVWVAATAGEGSPLRRRMAGLARAAGVREVAPDGPWPTAGLAVDALLGTGAAGAPRPEVAALLERLLDLSIPLVAIDGPTGLDLGTGAMHGAARADLSVTFGGFRRGHLLARDESGDVVVVDIGHPAAAPEWPVLVTDADAAGWLPRLRAGDHKGIRGRVVVVGGSAGMSGAVRLAGRAAFAAGAGLVHAVAPADTVAALIQAEPDLQTQAQDLDEPLADATRALLERADAVVVGPGLGRAAGRRELATAALEAARAAVLDADGLVAFQGCTAELARLARGRALVLTPHPGEFRGLFPELAAQREVDPWGAAVTAADELECTVLLKGVPTVVARPGRRPLTLAAGNPGLATGGSGDVLAGLIGSALARGVEPELAAALGAQALGRAADAAARRVTARALRPMDVIAALPDLWREWELLRTGSSVARPPVLFELPRPQTI